jgi:hypothetical protein
MLSLIIYFYPLYANPEASDHILGKKFKYKISQGCKEVLQYIKNIQKEIERYKINKDISN